MARDSIKSRQKDFDKRQERLLRGRNMKERGELAELAFLHKAAILGFAVARTYGDSDRYDFIVHSGQHFWKVQVKSSSTHENRAYKVQSQRSICGRSISYTADEIDFLVAYIVPEDDWYVIPVRALLARTAVRVYPRGSTRKSFFDKYREAWSLMG